MPRFYPFTSMKAALAVRNLHRSGGRLWVSLFGIAFATLLMAVQGSLLHSFTRPASQIVAAVDADPRLVADGTPTFEYVSPIPERYAFLALGVEGVRDAGRGIAGWAPIQRPNGDRTLVMLIGVENGYGGALPAVADLAGAKGLSDSALVLDASDATTLGFDGTLRTVQARAAAITWPRPGDLHPSSARRCCSRIMSMPTGFCAWSARRRASSCSMSRPVTTPPPCAMRCARA